MRGEEAQQSIWKSRKFVLGLVIFVFSLILGNVGKLIFFFVRLDNYWYRVLGAALYIISWPLGILGAIIAGKESIDYIMAYAKQKVKEGYKKTAELPSKATKRIRHAYRKKLVKK